MSDFVRVHDPVAWFEEQGAGFVRVYKNSKKPIGEEWQQAPCGLDAIHEHIQNNGNAGVIGGTHSNGLFFLDIDVDFPGVVELLGPFAKTPKIVRPSAPERGKLIYRTRESIPTSTTWRPDGAPGNSPWSERLSTGKQALIPPSKVDGNEYVLIDQEYEVMCLTEQEIAFVWYLATVGRRNLPEAPTPSTSARTPLTSNPKRTGNADAAIAAVLSVWEPLDVFVHFGRASEIVQERNEESRLLGNGGLFVSERGWFCFADNVGGYDAISAWTYCSRKKTAVLGKEFFDVLKEMAAAKGVTLPDTKTNTYTNGNSANLQSSPNGPHARIVDEDGVILDDGDTEDGDSFSFLNRGTQPVDLGMVGVYVELMYELAGSHRSFHQLGGLTAFAAAIQHRWLPLYFAPRGKMRPNVYGVVLGRTSFDHKTIALNKADEILSYDLMANCERLPGMFTEEGLYAELAEHPYGLVVKDEIGSLFAAYRKKYSEFLISFLTDAYGGILHGKRLAGSSVAAREIGLSILGATTYSEFFRSIRESDWDTGWLVRWLFALPDADYDPARPVRFPTVQDHATIAAIDARLTQLSNQSDGPYLIDDDAHQYLVDWRAELIHEAMNGVRHERVDAIVERYCTYGWKFAMILCAARGDNAKITLGEAEDAARLAENYMTQTYSLHAWGERNRIDGSLLQKAFLFIQRHNSAGEPVNRRSVGRALNLDASLRDKVIERLLDMGAVIENHQGKTTALVNVADKLPLSRLSTNQW